MRTCLLYIVLIEGQRRILGPLVIYWTPEDVSPYMVTGATDTQQEITESPNGRIHSNPNFERQESAHNISLDTTLPVQEHVMPEIPQDPIKRLTDVLTYMQNKPQSMTSRPVTTNLMKFDGKSKKFEFFEVLVHTMINMQPTMTERMEINHFIRCYGRGRCRQLGT